jgi:ribosomal-protein-alanine N-acetyltransferase
VIPVPDEIRTPRMLLRKPRVADAPLTLSAYAQEPAVTRYLTWRPHGDIAETRAVIDRFLAAWERQDEFCWLIYTSDAGDDRVDRGTDGG